MKNILFLLGIAVSISTRAQSPDGGVCFMENEKWESVREQAKRQDRLILMDCYTSWCGPCKAMVRDVFSQKEIGDYLNARFVNVKYDMEKGEGKRLKEIYASYISAYPTFLLIDQEGKVIQQLVGYQEPEQLLQGIKDGLEGRSVFRYQEMYESGNRDLFFLKAYITSLENALLSEKARKIVQGFMDTIPVERLKQKDVWEFVRPYLDDPYTPQFEFVFYNLVHYWNNLGDDRYKLEKQMRIAIHQAVEVLIGKNYDENQQLLPLTNDPEKINKLRGYLRRESLPLGERMMAQLRIHELKLQEKWEDVFTYLSVCYDAGVLLYEEYYINESIEYLAERATNIALLEQSLKLMMELQEAKNRAKGQLFRTNFYGTLAILHEKLGHVEEARACKLKSEELRKQAKETYERIRKHE